MLTNQHIVRIIKEAALLMHHSYNPESLASAEMNNRTYTIDEFDEFKRDFFETGLNAQIMGLQYHLSPAEFAAFIKAEEQFVLSFIWDDNKLTPVVIHPAGQSRKMSRFDAHEIVQTDFQADSNWLTDSKGEIPFFVLIPQESLVSDHVAETEGRKLNPVTRLFRLLHAERKQINYIFFYGIVAGLVSLALPLGIQSIVELISGGVFFSSVYVLIGIVILGVLFGGLLNIMQITLVENLQRRIFTKAALEFSFRLPRLRAEAIMSSYAPELVNRFFDILTIQKGLPKLLIDFISGVMQILFGLVLLSLYHPLFIFFSIGLIIFLVVVFFFTGPPGLRWSIAESKYKYKVVHWLEELARAMNSFKVAGNTDLPIKKADLNVNNYLVNRRNYFRVLLTQFSFILAFKTLVTASLLIVGTILVVDRQITLGQFVAAEVIIILLLSAVEKIMMYMDVLYDLLTAVDKVSHVTDLPLEKSGGLDFPPRKSALGYSFKIRDLKYRYPNQPGYALKGINLDIQCGEHLCLAGPGSAGKTTFTNILSGIYFDYEGIVAINGYSLRDLDLTHLRNKIGKNISQEDIFEGTVLENIMIGKPNESVEDAIESINLLQLDEEINKLPQGLNTILTSGGKNLSQTFVHKLILARVLTKKPELIILNDFFMPLRRGTKLEILQHLTRSQNKCTLIIVSNDPLVMQACKRILIMNDGLIEADGSYEELMKQGLLAKYLDYHA